MSSNTLFVDNLSSSVTIDDLKSLFSKFGPVNTADIQVKGEKRHAFVNLEVEESKLPSIIKRLNSTKWKGKAITIQVAKEKEKKKFKKKSERVINFYDEDNDETLKKKDDKVINFDDSEEEDKDANHERKSDHNKVNFKRNSDHFIGENKFDNKPCKSFKDEDYPLNDDDVNRVDNVNKKEKIVSVRKLVANENHSKNVVENTLFISNLSSCVTDGDLKNLLTDYGTVKSTEMRGKGERRFAFVNLSIEESKLSNLIENLNSTKFKGNKITIEVAKEDISFKKKDVKEFKRNDKNKNTNFEKSYDDRNSNNYNNNNNYERNYNDRNSNSNNNNYNERNYNENKIYDNKTRNNLKHYPSDDIDEGEMVNKIEKRFYIGNLAPDVSEGELKQLFKKFGHWKSYELKEKNGNHFAFVNLYINDPSDVQNIINNLNNLPVNGNCITIQSAKESYLQQLERERESLKNSNENEVPISTRPINVNPESYKPKININYQNQHKFIEESNIERNKESEANEKRLKKLQEKIDQENKKNDLISKALNNIKTKTFYENENIDNESYLINNDPRFKISNNFYDKNNEKYVHNEEKQTNHDLFNIMETGKVHIPRFDPTKHSENKFVVKEMEVKSNEKKVKFDKNVANEKPPEISKERFYEYSKDLKNLFNKDDEEEKEEEFNLSSLSNHKLKSISKEEYKSQKNDKKWFGYNPFIHDSSDDENEQIEDLKEEHNNSNKQYKFKNNESFFFVKDDPRLKMDSFFQLEKVVTKDKKEKNMKSEKMKTILAKRRRFCDNKIKNREYKKMFKKQGKGNLAKKSFKTIKKT